MTRPRAGLAKIKVTETGSCVWRRQGGLVLDAGVHRCQTHPQGTLPFAHPDTEVVSWDR